MRIVVRTRYIAEIETLTAAGADRVIAEELESIVQLFAEVLRDYRIPAEEIEAHEDAVRRGGYQALLKARAIDEKPVVECSVPEDCFDTRTVVVRAGTPITTRPLAELELEKEHGIRLESVRREGKAMGLGSADLIIRPGDELVLAGASAAIAKSAFLFQQKIPDSTDRFEDAGFSATANVGPVIDTEQVIELTPDRSTACSHLDQIRPVLPSAPGCEECLKLGDIWVHLRICMSCGHVGCCDSSKNKHASKHFSQTTHPIMKSGQPAENWAWCYVDETYL